MNLDEVLGKLKGLPPEDRAALEREVAKGTAGLKWIPNPGPQTEAFYCPADLLLYGGQGGGGKTDLLAGLALTAHRKSLLMRRQYTDLGALTERVLEVHGSRRGFNGSPPPKLKTDDGRVVDLGAAKHLGDEDTWQGQPHDLFGADEVVQMLEQQIRFLLGWVRTTDEGQRCRAVLASNPPVTAEGQWIVGMFRPWLDPTHDNPAQPGELRWYVTDPDGKDLEVDGPEDRRIWDGKVYIPKSRTFIPAALGDNPYLINTGYQATLDALPEPLRSAVRDGNFMAAREDRAFQVIPTAWIVAAQNRWREYPPRDVPMCAVGCDVAQGGANNLVIAARHDGWYAPLVKIPGKDVPGGREAAAEIIKVRRDKAVVVIDMGGGYGTAPKEHLESNGVEVAPYKGAEATARRSRDGHYGFTNVRSAAYWTFREALDPDQEGGSAIMLPDDPEMVADLTAPDFEVTARGIKITPKEKLTEDLGRSTDAGDATVMAWWEGMHGLMGNVNMMLMRPDQRVGGRTGRQPQVLARTRYRQ